MIVVERSFWLLFVILLILAPFVTLVIYAIFVGKCWFGGVHWLVVFHGYWDCFLVSILWDVH